MAMYNNNICVFIETRLLYRHILYIVSNGININNGHAGLSTHDNTKRLWLPLKYNNNDIESIIDTDVDIDESTPHPTKHTISFSATTEIDTEEEPIKPTCQSIQNAKFDVILLYDNSCGLNPNDCNDLLDGVGSIISLLLNPSTRVQTMRIGTNGNTQTIVAFEESELQQDTSEYIEAIHQKGHCHGQSDGNGNINLVQALNDSMNIFDYDIVDKHNKIIIVSACYDERVCDDDYPESIIALQLKYKNIQIYPINLIKSSSNAHNVITSEVADIYLKCCNQRICFGQNAVDIVDNCLYPNVCEVPIKYDQMSGYMNGESINPLLLGSNAYHYAEQHYFPQHNYIGDSSVSSESFESFSSDSSDSKGDTPMPTPQPTPKPTFKPSLSPTARPAPLPHPNTGSPYTYLGSTTHINANVLPIITADEEIYVAEVEEVVEANTYTSNDKQTSTYTYLSPKPYVPEVKCDVAMDFIVLFDDSCGLSFDNCGMLLEGVSDIISTLLLMGARVQTMQFKENTPPDVVVGFDDEELQQSISKYLDIVRTFGECRNGGNGYTDLYQALNDAILYFDVSDDRSDRIIIVSGCMDYRDAQLCTKTVDKLKDNDIEIYAVNLIKASIAENVILSRQQAKEYLLCLTEEDEDRVCVFKDKEGVSVEEFEYIIDYCLLPQICDDNSNSGSSESWSSDSFSSYSGSSESFSDSQSDSYDAYIHLDDHIDRDLVNSDSASNE